MATTSTAVVMQESLNKTPKQTQRQRMLDEDMVRNGMKLAPFYDQLFPNTDNFPLLSSTDYGKSGTPSYYFMAEPSSNALANTARYSPLGKRLTYGLATDVWINNFVLKFPGDGLDALALIQLNQEIIEHLTTIGFFDEGRLATGYNYEQGEALLMVYRQGDGSLKSYEALVTEDPDYFGFQGPADQSKEIIRVEAVNKMDYSIPMIKSFGLPMYYNINFWSAYNRTQGFNIHPSRVIRIRTDRVDYDQYYGMAKLKPCFAQLTILQNICRAAGMACHKFAYGIPWVSTRGVRTAADRKKVEQAIGDPSMADFFITNKENIDDIKMLGYASSQMNMSEAANMMIDQISASSQIPEPILMGKESGVTQGGAVNERSYFATLDAEHSLINRYIRQFIAIDPFFPRLFKKYKIQGQFVIDWGLRQVMTMEQEADYKMRLYTNIISKMQFATFEECRAEAGLPSFTEYFNDKAHPERAGICEFLYSISPQQLDATVPNLGQWRQRALMEIVKTPEERQTQALVENNNPDNASAVTKKEAGGENPSMAAPSRAGKEESSFARIAAKMERKGADAIPPEILAVMDKVCGTAQAKEAMLQQMMDEFAETKKNFDKSNRELSVNELAELGGCNKNKIYDLMNLIENIKKNKDAKMKDEKNGNK